MISSYLCVCVCVCAYEYFTHRKQPSLRQEQQLYKSKRAKNDCWKQISCCLQVTVYSNTRVCACMLACYVCAAVCVWVCVCINVCCVNEPQSDMTLKHVFSIWWSFTSFKKINKCIGGN